MNSNLIINLDNIVITPIVWLILGILFVMFVVYILGYMTGVKNKQIG